MIVNPASLDFIFSQSVMEHVNNIQAVYDACNFWLKPGGLMSHRIDHSSHGITHSWNGRYEISDMLWNVILGKRPYLLNRLTPDQHIYTIESLGFEILSQSSFLRVMDDEKTIDVDSLPDDLFSVTTSTILARKLN